MDVLQGIGYGIVAFAILIVVGLVVLTKLGDTTAKCLDGDFPTYDVTSRACSNGTDTIDATGNAFTTGNYISTQLGSTGLSGWIPAIIAVAVGVLFLSYFLGRRRR